MKYVIFEQKDLLMPVIVPDHITHSQVKIEGATPVSAGFLAIKNGKVTEVYGKSESMKLSPMTRDKDLLEKALKDMGTMYFFKP